MTDDIKTEELNGVYRIPCACPTCFANLSAASSSKGEKGSRAPKKGDVTVCLYCGTLLEFGEGLSLAPVSDATLVELSKKQRDKMNFFSMMIKQRIEKLSRNKTRH